jgi:integrase
MARAIRGPKLETRSGRLKLPIAKKPVYVRIADGLSLGYRRNRTAGTWVMKVPDGKGGAATKTIGTADDFEDADGARVLTWWQAQDKARGLLDHGDVAKPAVMPMTVSQAVDDYLGWLRTKNARTALDTQARLEKHFILKFGPKMVTELTKTGLEKWLAGMVRTDGTDDQIRASKDSANRVLSMVKAALNRAMQDPANGIKDDSAWRLVKPFRSVGKARDVHFSIDEARSLIQAAREQEPAFADLLTAGFMTGARYGELASCIVRDFDRKGGTLYIAKGKTGPRVVTLHREAIKFFGGLAEGRPKTGLLLPRTDGAPWGIAHQHRRMKAALLSADLDPDGTFYSLRHSYISRAIEAGMPLTIMAENCGTSVRMIEKNYAKMLAEKRREFVERAAPRLVDDGGKVVKIRKGA